MSFNLCLLPFTSRDLRGVQNRPMCSYRNYKLLIVKSFRQTQLVFYPRMVNKTNITFSSGQLCLPNKGLKCNLGHKQKNWITNLAFEAETPITFLPTNEQECIRHQVAQNIKKL